MAIYLNEENFGADDGEVFFPNVQSCLSLSVVDTSGRIAGAHLTMMTEKSRLDTILAGMKGFLAHPAKAAYAIGGTSLFQSHGNPALKFPSGFKTSIQSAFNLSQGIRCFDTLPFLPKDVNGACGVMVRVWEVANKTRCAYAIHGAYAQGKMVNAPESVREIAGGGKARKPVFYFEWTAQTMNDIPETGAQGLFWI